MKKYIHTILCICSVLFLSSCGRVREPQSHESTEAVQFTTDTENGAKNGTEEACGYVLEYSAPYHVTENHLTRSNGPIRYNGHRETWYSIHEPGQTVTAVHIPDKHIAEDGTIRDQDGYVCVASSDLPFYTKVMTSVGPGKVYDCGCSSGTIDVYTNW